jgi:hypothetical protein
MSFKTMSTEQLLYSNINYKSISNVTNALFNLFKKEELYSIEFFNNSNKLNLSFFEYKAYLEKISTLNNIKYKITLICKEHNAFFEFYCCINTLEVECFWIGNFKNEEEFLLFDLKNIHLKRLLNQNDINTIHLWDEIVKKNNINIKLNDFI